MKKYNTILFVPHARAPFRKITISSRSLTFLAAGAGFVLLCALLFGPAFRCERYAPRDWTGSEMLSQQPSPNRRSTR